MRWSSRFSVCITKRHGIARNLEHVPMVVGKPIMLIQVHPDSETLNFFVFFDALFLRATSETVIYNLPPLPLKHAHEYPCTRIIIISSGLAINQRQQTCHTSHVIASHGAMPDAPSRNLLLTPLSPPPLFPPSTAPPQMQLRYQKLQQAQLAVRRLPYKPQIMTINNSCHD